MIEFKDQIITKKPRNVLKCFTFTDMFSGGSCKAYPFEYIYIEAFDLEEAEYIFLSRFPDTDLHGAACDTCGDNYSIGEEESITEATKYHIGRKENIEEYLKKENVLFIKYKEE